MKQRKNPKGGGGTHPQGRAVDLWVWMVGWLSISRRKMGFCK